MLYQAIITVVILILTFIAQRILRLSINNFVEVKQIRRVRGELVGRISRIIVWLLAIFLLTLIWGVNTQNLWVYVTGVLGVLAVAFFAAWSLLSNVMAGLFLFISDPFRIDDEIVILPEEVQGVVKDMKVLFVVLEDKDGNIIHIPSNLLFQKIIKKVNQNNR